MPEETVVQQEQTQQAAPQETQKPTEDIISRASKVKLEEKPAKQDDSFNVNDIQKIPDPQARELAEKAYKSLERGYQQKFQSLASERKELEKQKELNSTWTPDRVNALLQDPTFVKAAQTVAGTQNPQGSGLTDEEYSALTPNEKAKLHQMEQEVLLLKQQNQQAHWQQQDTQLTQRYANYQPEVVDQLMHDLLTGKVQATREHLWRVYDYENAVKRAYELGKQDRQLDTKEKIDSFSPDARSMQSQYVPPQKDAKETDPQYFKRIALERLRQAQGG